MTKKKAWQYEDVPKSERVYMSQGHLLAGNPSRRQIVRACVDGQYIENKRSGEKTYCRSQVEGGGHRYTTSKWWNQFLVAVNGGA